ncbi:MTU1 thiouridylase, partial [Pseudoatta argentina]
YEMIRNVIVAMSGGVDSAMTALLLKNKGFNITGVFMKNWDVRDETEKCVLEKDYDDARWICDKLEIFLIQINFVKEYWNEVFSDLVEKYQNGYTPNPDILCNKNIKFDKFFHLARDKFQADAIATGHYAKTSFGPYLENYEANTSKYIADKPGNYIDLDSGLQIGKHDGIHKRTIGQRCKIAGALKPYYVFNKDQESNTITVVGGTTHSALYTDFLITRKIHWISEEPCELRWNNGVLNCNFRFQHRDPLIACRVYKMSNDRLFIRLDAPLRAITKGQVINNIQCIMKI